MPEATILYTVTAVVVAALIVWVAAVLKTAKEPWARAAPSRGELVAVNEESASAETSSIPEVASAKDASGVDADSTARATPVALASQAKTKAADESDEESKQDDAKSTEA